MLGVKKKIEAGVKYLILFLPIKPGFIKMITKQVHTNINCQIIWRRDNVDSKDLYPILGSASDKVV